MYIWTRQLTTMCSLGMLLISGTSCSTSDPTLQVIHAESTQNKPESRSLITDKNQKTTFDRLRTNGIRNDDNIDLYALEPGEVCVINISKAEAKKLDIFANAQGFTKKKRRTLDNLGFIMSILHVPAGQTVQQGIAQLRHEFPTQIIDANHHYTIQGDTRSFNPQRYGQQLVGWDNRTLRCTTDNFRIGMIDTAVDNTHPHLLHQNISTETFLTKAAPKAPRHHGTAVATLLIGKNPAITSSIFPQATLFVAEAFRQKKEGHTEATTWSVVRALDWLVEQHVQVINLSLGGPNNALLRYAVHETLRQKIPIVAAAGNSGPQSRPLYPAAQKGVIAVTALDAQLLPYRHASQGDYISFSAPGVDIWIPHSEKHGAFMSGTSFATPFVTTAVAALKHSNLH